jgi:hypothetical protein
MPAHDPIERSLIASLAISSRWANTPAEERKAALAKATAASMARFEREVDPEGKLDPAERAYSAGMAKRAYMARLALKSVQARRTRKAAGS